MNKEEDLPFLYRFSFFGQCNAQSTWYFICMTGYQKQLLHSYILVNSILSLFNDLQKSPKWNVSDNNNTVEKNERK